MSKDKTKTRPSKEKKAAERLEAYQLAKRQAASLQDEAPDTDASPKKRGSTSRRGGKAPGGQSDHDGEAEGDGTPADGPRRSSRFGAAEEDAGKGHGGRPKNERAPGTVEKAGGKTVAFVPGSPPRPPLAPTRKHSGASRSAHARTPSPGSLEVSLGDSSYYSSASSGTSDSSSYSSSSSSSLEGSGVGHSLHRHSKRRRRERSGHGGSASRARRREQNARVAYPSTQLEDADAERRRSAEELTIFAGVLKALREPTVSNGVRSEIVQSARRIARLHGVGSPAPLSPEDWSRLLSGYLLVDTTRITGGKCRKAPPTPEIYLQMRGTNATLLAAVNQAAARTGAGGAHGTEGAALQEHFDAIAREARSTDGLVAQHGLRYLFSAPGRLQVGALKDGLTLAIALEAGEDVAAVFKREAVKRWVPLSVDETVRRQVARTKMELDRGAHSLDVRVRDPLAPPSKSSRRRARSRKAKRRSGGD